MSERNSSRRHSADRGRDDLGLTRSSRAILCGLTAVGGAVAFVVAMSGSLVIGLAVGVLVLASAMAMIHHYTSKIGVPDPSRRRFLRIALGGIGVASLPGWSALAVVVRRLVRPDPTPTLEASARDLGAEYLELVIRGYHPDRSGDLQLLVTPHSSSN